MDIVHVHVHACTGSSASIGIIRHIIQICKHVLLFRLFTLYLFLHLPKVHVAVFLGQIIICSWQVAIYMHMHSTYSFQTVHCLLHTIECVWDALCHCQNTIMVVILFQVLTQSTFTIHLNTVNTMHVRSSYLYMYVCYLKVNYIYMHSVWRKRGGAIPPPCVCILLAYMCIGGCHSVHGCLPRWHIQHNLPQQHLQLGKPYLICRMRLPITCIEYSVHVCGDRQAIVRVNVVSAVRVWWQLLAVQK